MPQDGAVTTPEPQAGQPWELVFARGRVSFDMRVRRLRSKSWQIGQCGVAAGVAWFVAKNLLDHPTPFFAPISAVVSLGLTYGQRRQRVVEMTIGVAIGVFVGDLLVHLMGSGGWQMALIVMLAMSSAILLNASGLLVTQAAVQSIVITALVPQGGQAFLRWTDALVGGAVALVAATVVPRAPLRRPREQAAFVVGRIAQLLRGSATAIRDGDLDPTLELLRDARATDVLVDELRLAADEGLAVVRSSPFRVRHKGSVRRLADYVEPLDLALRNTRVLVRRVAVAVYRRAPLPRAYALLCDDLADVVDEMAAELRADRTPASVQPRLVALAHATSAVERSHDLSAEVVLAQLRSIVADLLRLTGMGSLESTDAIPPLRPE
jgi:uncharacterized membrane protein YgaE (UPF0421/DUF939 family)